MKSKKPLITILGSALFIALATTGISIAWFSSIADLRSANTPIGGIVQDTYYESGTGHAADDPNTPEIEGPYVITRPRHLYNLAWLQDLGFYNKHDGSENARQYYFKLGNNIDMSQFGAIPPIGTEENPFMGNFDGQGFVISGVTISNDFGDYNSHPSVISDWNGETTQPINQPHILGLFGVVGDYSSQGITTNKPTGYSSAVNEFKNTGITGATIKTAVRDSLMGVAAGYVSGNMSNVLVDVSTVDVSDDIVGNTSSYGGYTQNISDYTLVGYTESVADVKKAEESIYGVEVTSGLTLNALDQGDSENWGGSINMKTIYYRLYAIKKNKAANNNVESSFNWREEKHYYNNVINDDETVGTKTITAYGDDSETPHLQRFNGSEQASHKFIGNYNYFHRLNSLRASNATTDQSYLYLCGGHDEIRTYNTYYDHSGYCITDGANYLVFNGSNLNNTTDSSQATLWSFASGSGKSISTIYNGSTYYLSNSGGTLSIGTTPYSSWTISLSDSKYDIYNGNFHLTISGGTWFLIDTTKVYITDGTNYMTCSYSSNTTGTIGNTTTIGNGTTWSFSTYNGTGTISCSVTRYNTTYTYYLRNNNGTLQASTTSTNWTISSSGGTITIQNNGYYLTYDNGWTIYNPSLQTPYYLIYDDAGNYMAPANNYYVQSTTERNSALKFGYYSSGNSKYYYDLSNTNYYLSMENTNRYQVEMYGWDDYVWRLVDDSGNVLANPYGTGYLRAFNKSNATAYGTNYIVKQNNNSQPWTSSTSSKTRFTVEYIDPSATPFISSLANPVFSTVINETISSETTGPDYHQTSGDSTKSTDNSHMYYEATDTTYFPLNVESDVNTVITDGSNGTIQTKINNGDLDPKTTNTGYIISGSNLHGKATYTAGEANIRVSEYPSTAGDYNISNSFKTTYNTLEKFVDSGIRTIKYNNGTLTTTTMSADYSENAYPRYKDSKKSFYENSLTTAYNASTKTYTCTNNVYGLHFMDSTISTKYLVNADYVSILSNKCDKFQFPVDCIDFNLKQKGVINFFAGSYFPGNNSFFSLHEIIRNNDAVVKGDPQNKEFTSFNTINQIKEIEEIYSTDVGTKTTKYANIYKYKDATGSNMYSIPYRVDANQNKYEMNKNSTADTNVSYTYGTMGESDFNAYKNTYGYELKLNTKQIGKQASSFTLNYIYYFEFPMNPGEYCLGSVDGGTGAYLLYLDIGANAAKIERTIFYEHFTIEEKTYTYPTGVSLKDLGDPSTYSNREAVIDISVVVDASDSACMRIVATAKGEFTIDRNSNSVALTRAQTNKAPPIYASDEITRVYETSNSSDVAVEHLTSHIYDVKRMEYYDYNVNLEYLTVTTFADYGEDTDGDPETPLVYSREYVYQTVYSGNTTSSAVTATYKYNAHIEPVDEDPDDGLPAVDPLTLMKIYNTNGGSKYDSEDIIDVTAIVIDGGKMSDDLVVSFNFFQDNGNFYEDITSLMTHVDLDNETGTYYLDDYYIISFIPTSGSTIAIKITSLANGATIYYETTLITGSGQEITEGPQP